jgi:hypothetical protein
LSAVVAAGTAACPSRNTCLAAPSAASAEPLCASGSAGSPSRPRSTTTRRCRSTTETLARTFARPTRSGARVDHDARLAVDPVRGAGHVGRLRCADACRAFHPGLIQRQAGRPAAQLWHQVPRGHAGAEQWEQRERRRRDVGQHRRRAVGDCGAAIRRCRLRARAYAATVSPQAQRCYAKGVAAELVRRYGIKVRRVQTRPAKFDPTTSDEESRSRLSLVVSAGGHDVTVSVESSTVRSGSVLGINQDLVVLW